MPTINDHNFSTLKNFIIKKKKTKIAKTLQSGYNRETILEKPKLLMKKGKRTEAILGKILLFEYFSKKELNVKV